MIQQPPLAFERVAEMLLAATVLTVLATAMLALTRVVWTSGVRRMGHRHSLLAPGERTFVARLSREGPELFVVGDGVRRLSLPRRVRTTRWSREGDIGPALAARLLFEALGRDPSRDLTSAFVEEHLGYGPVDGFVLPTAEVVAWLDAHDSAPSQLRSRAAEALAAWMGFVASWFHPPRRSSAGVRDARPG